MNRIICLVTVILILTGVAGAQDTRSTIIGYVKDAQGAVVPNASVVVTNTETNASVKLTTNDSGYYEAPLLMPGPYTVTAESTGFKKAVRSGFTLQVTDRREVDLDAGCRRHDRNGHGDRRGAAGGCEQDGFRPRARRCVAVRDLPANANTVFTMIRFSAGVQAGNPPTLLGPHSTQGGSSYDTGTGLGGNTWTIDGAINDGNARYTANLPSVDVVAEDEGAHYVL